MDKQARIYELIKLLNEASDSYYNKNTEIMSNFEYDSLYDELVKLEQETGIYLADSPTMKVGFDVSDGLEKFTFDTPMLSLDKTKSIDRLQEFISDREGVLSYKLDGLTVVLTYENGELTNAVTRGNGRVGEIIIQNARHFKALPLKISYKERLIIRGEAVISYEDFDRINSHSIDVEDKYKNPRNLCSGTVRALDSSVVAKRGVHFFAFAVVEGMDEENLISQRYRKLKDLGFEVVEHIVVNKDNIRFSELTLSSNVASFPYAIDGLVLIYNEIDFGLSLGTTSKFPRNAIAFKWEDELVNTTLREVFWSASRTGRINPVAIFDPVEIEGTTVSRASVHNLSTVKGLKLGISDTISVYKANMIIPQIADNHTKSDNIIVPKLCPVCNSLLRIDDNDGIQVLFCDNLSCPAKLIKGFELFVSREGFNIEGLSSARLEMLIARGYIHEFADIFKLAKFKDEIKNIDGMGEKSVSNLLNAIETSKKVSLAAFIYSLGIAQIGRATANVLANEYKSIESLIQTDKERLLEIDGIGEIVADCILDYFNDEIKLKFVNNLIACVDIEQVSEINNKNADIYNKTFVITGSLNNFDNRNMLKDLIEKNGGRVTSSVSSSTDYLINNDINSGSSKNKKAKELNIPIISEETIIGMLNY